MQKINKFNKKIKLNNKKVRKLLKIKSNRNKKIFKSKMKNNKIRTKVLRIFH